MRARAATAPLAPRSRSGNVVAFAAAVAAATTLTALRLDVRGSMRACAQPVAALNPSIDILRRAVALTVGSARPAEDSVLAAILDAQRQKSSVNRQAPFYHELTGGGREGGKRWRLVYLANRNAVVAARKGTAPPSPLDRGWYVDGIVTAVQRFEDAAKRVNQNGVFELLGLGGFFFGYFARFKWPSPEKRTTMAFQPVTNNLHAFGQDWSWPFAGTTGDDASDRVFESARLQDLNIFNFFYVDGDVAVAQGASGSVALWGATDADWDAKHLVASTSTWAGMS